MFSRYICLTYYLKYNTSWWFSYAFIICFISFYLFPSCFPIRFITVLVSFIKYFSRRIWSCYTYNLGRHRWWNVGMKNWHVKHKIENLSPLSYNLVDILRLLIVISKSKKIAWDIEYFTFSTSYFRWISLYGSWNSSPSLSVQRSTISR